MEVYLRRTSAVLARVRGLHDHRVYSSALDRATRCPGRFRGAKVMVKSVQFVSGGTAQDACVPEPIVSSGDYIDPEHEVLLADSVGLALLVVLDTLPPAETTRVHIARHVCVSFDEIAPIVGRSATAARQLASRAHRRVPGAAPIPDGDRLIGSVIDDVASVLRLNMMPSGPPLL
jgi:hypothetical protein